MKKSFLILLAIGTLFSACKKEAGEGGDASISGKVILEKRLVLSNPEIVLYTAPAVDYEVFIIYGDGPGPDDRIRTNYDGEYEFPYLREGEYEVYVFSDDTTDAAINGQAAETMAVRLSATIGSRKTNLTLPDLKVYE